MNQVTIERPRGEPKASCRKNMLALSTAQIESAFYPRWKARSIVVAFNRNPSINCDSADIAAAAAAGAGRPRAPGWRVKGIYRWWDEGLGPTDE